MRFKLLKKLRGADLHCITGSIPLWCVYAEGALLDTYLDEVFDTGIAAVRLRSCSVKLNVRHLLHPDRS